MSTGGLTYKECLAPKASESFLELFECGVLRNGEVVDIVNRWTYTQRMPGTESLRKLLELIESWMPLVWGGD